MSLPSNVDSILGLEAVLPEQFHSPSRAYSADEKELMVAVFEDAWKIALLPEPEETTARREYRDAINWFASESSRGTYSFENICSALGLNSDAVRDELKKKKAEASTETPTDSTTPARPKKQIHRVSKGPRASVK
ncbi:MAG: hypothetical protein SFW62_09785 [Alphaproteobacteria bacterium]|nr:hypothetical protein [Alphaproteobacteria bacterium]